MNNPHLSSLRRLKSDPSFRLRHYLELAKLHLCIYVGLTAVLGHVSGLGKLTAESVLAGAGVLILAFGSAALNNVQDRAYDRTFVRTAGRVIPSGKVPVVHALGIALILLIAGWGILYKIGSVSCFLTGLLAVILYNGMYTPLKKKTLWAMVPGVLSGMLPVWIGWVGAGRSPADFQPMILMLILGLWQVPHFMIIALKARRRPGCPSFPIVSDRLNSREIRIQTVLWTSLYSMGIFGFLLTGGMDASVSAFACGLNALLIPVVLSAFLFGPRIRLTAAFTAVNLSMLVFLGAGISYFVFH